MTQPAERRFVMEPRLNSEVATINNALDTKVDTTDARLSDQRVPTDNSVTSAKIVNGSIVNEDISATAGIAISKINSLQTELDDRAYKNSPVFTGTVTTPLSTAGYVTTTSGGILSSVATIPNSGLTNSSVTLNGAIVNLGESITVPANTPAGIVSQFAGSSAPSGYLMCDGSAVSRSTYAALFTAIGVAYGSGDGSTTFNLPNLKGKIPVGLDATQTEFDVLGETGGEKAVTLTSAQIPAHGHTYSGTTSTNGNHNHSAGDYGHGHSLRGWNGGDGNGADWADGNETRGGVTTGYASIYVNSNGDHSHTYSGTTANNTGGGGSHNNLQPYVVMNYIIKT